MLEPVWEDKDGKAAGAFDADSKSMWHSAWRPSVAPLPHELILDLGRTRRVAGVASLPRQDAVGNQPGTVRVFVAYSEDALPQTPQHDGSFGSYGDSPQGWHETVMPTPATGRFVKLVFTAVASNGPCLAAAELEILVEN